MGDDASACEGKIGQSCGWTTTNLGQGYHCTVMSWGADCEPGGTTCPGGAGGGTQASGGGAGGGSTGGGQGSGGTAPAAPTFGPYKDVSINLNWNTNVISTLVPGSATELGSDMAANGASTVTLAFATGECGSESWIGVKSAALAAANVSRMTAAGVHYILGTGGAAGSFTCGSDEGLEAFLAPWAAPNLVGVDFDIEVGQSEAVITDLVRRIKAAHVVHPELRFSLTLATLANNDGASSGHSLGDSAPDSLNATGDLTLAAVRSVLGFDGSPETWPSYVTVNLMVMNYGSADPGVCVVSGGLCDMGESAIQSAFNLRDRFGVPFASIELTPMIGRNDVASELFTLADVDTLSRFAITYGLAGVHYWSYDRDVDCSQDFASPTCNSMGGVGAHGFLRRFIAAGLK